MGGAARCRGGREVWILPGGNVLVAPGEPGGKPGGKPGGTSSTNRCSTWETRWSIFYKQARTFSVIVVASIVAHLLKTIFFFGIFSQVDVGIILISTAEARLCPQRFYCVDLVPDMAF